LAKSPHKSYYFAAGINPDTIHEAFVDFARVLEADRGEPPVRIDAIVHRATYQEMTKLTRTDDGNETDVMLMPYSAPQSCFWITDDATLVGANSICLLPGIIDFQSMSLRHELVSQARL
jgi:hypothetical protein